MKTTAIAIAIILLLHGCSSGDNQAASAPKSGDHVWKEQVSTMDKARDSEKAMLDAAAKQAEAVQEQTE